MRTEAEKEALYTTRRTAELRATLLQDTLRVLKDMRSPHGRMHESLPEVVEARAERNAYVARLQVLSDEAEIAYEAADNAAHAIEHEEARCNCKAFDAKAGAA